MKWINLSFFFHLFSKHTALIVLCKLLTLANINFVDSTIKKVENGPKNIMQKPFVNYFDCYLCARANIGYFGE